VKRHAIRFGVGTSDEPYVPVWSIWAQRSEVYLGARDIAGTLKISLHRPVIGSHSSLLRAVCVISPLITVESRPCSGCGTALSAPLCLRRL
jgi:hypothetical protein